MNNNYYCHKEGYKEISMTAQYCKTVGNHELFFVIKYLHLHSNLILHSVVQLCILVQTQLITTLLP